MQNFELDSDLIIGSTNIKFYNEYEFLGPQIIEALMKCSLVLREDTIMIT